MTWWAISNTPPQFVDGNGDPYSGAVLKFYQDGTTTNTVMATDDTGGTTLTSVALDSNGYPTNASAVFIPHIDQKYKTALYATQAAADADTGAIWTVDNVTAPIIAGSNTDINAKVSSNDTTTGYLNGKLVAGAGVTLTENSDGGNETLSIIASGVMTLGTEQASTSGTAIDFTSIPSGTKQIIITFEAVSTSGTDAKQVQLGDAGGFETAGYTSRSISVQAGPTVGSITGSGGILIESTLAADALNGQITLVLKDDANFTWVGTGIIMNGAEIITTQGIKSLTAELDSVRITTTGGTDTFDAGSINILYNG